MISSFEKYIKAAIDAKKYSVVCEMANIVHSDKNHINIMTYPGKDVRVYKNRDDEVQILCPKNISYVQESNLTKAISTGTIFDNADEVDKYAGFIVKTKMPIDAMTNKGLKNPYKLREVVGSTIGVMNEDGEVDVSDADVDNGNNIIDDLLKKDSKEFKDVKNVVDDYLDNDDHSFGYDTDFTYDIQQLRDEINRFKDADIAPEDSITDADWDDNWGSTSSIMGDHTDAEDEENEDDTPDKDEDDIEVSDDDSESEDPDLTFEEYSIMMESGDMFIQEGAIKTLKKIGYDPRTKTFITDIPEDGGTNAKKPCKIKFDLFSPSGAYFSFDTSTIHIPVKDLLGNTDLVISTLKHEEGHFYISLDRKNFEKDFAKAKKLVDKHGSKLSDHENAREEYVAGLYSANKAGVESRVKQLKQYGYKFRIEATKVKHKINPRYISKYFERLRKTLNFIEHSGGSLDDHDIGKGYVAICDLLHSSFLKDLALENLIKLFTAEQKVFMKPGPGEYAHRLNSEDDEYRDSIKRVSDNLNSSNVRLKQTMSETEKELKKIKEEWKKYVDKFNADNKRIKESKYLSPERKKSMLAQNKEYYQDRRESTKDRYEYIKHQAKSTSSKLNELEKVLIENIDSVYKAIDDSVKVMDNSIKARIAFVRKYGNKATQESYAISSPAYKMNPNHKAVFLNTDDDDIDNDTDVSYNMKKECGDASISIDPSSGSNVNTTMEEDDTTTPMPAFSSGSGTDIHTESDEVDESFTPKAVVPDDLDTAPSDGHNPLLSPIHEGFMMKRPKKLKAIDIRGIVSYVTIEMNDIKDANDQAMIAGYVCSKLELIDFYITVLDTHDDRYVVPHTRQYLVDGQRQLSDLLTRILKIRPINRADRIWQIEKII